MTTPDKAAERHLLVTVQSKPEYRPRVHELLLELVALVRSEPGCLYYNLFQQAEDPATFVLAAGWANDEAVAAHPAYPTVLDQVRPLLATPWEVLSVRRVSENPA